MSEQKYVLSSFYNKQNKKKCKVFVVFRLLEDDPTLYHLFSFSVNISSTTRDHKLMDETLRKHGEGVMVVFDNLITNLDKPDNFFAIIDKHATAHSVKRNFKPEYFQVGRDSIVSNF